MCLWAPWVVYVRGCVCQGLYYVRAPCIYTCVSRCNRAVQSRQAAGVVHSAFCTAHGEAEMHQATWLAAARTTRSATAEHPVPQAIIDPKAARNRVAIETIVSFSPNPRHPTLPLQEETRPRRRRVPARGPQRPADTVSAPAARCWGPKVAHGQAPAAREGAGWCSRPRAVWLSVVGDRAARPAAAFKHAAPAAAAPAERFTESRTPLRALGRGAAGQPRRAWRGGRGGHGRRGGLRA